MGEQELHEAIQDILDYARKPGREMGAGWRLAPFWLGTEPNGTAEQADALMQMLKQHIEHEIESRKTQLGQKPHADFPTGKHRHFIDDLKNPDALVQNLCTLWVHHIDQLSREVIAQQAMTSKATIHNRIRAGFAQLVKSIRLDLPPSPQPLPPRPPLLLLYKDDCIAEGQYTPVEHLGIGAELAPYIAFTGLRWASAFAFTGALVAADGKSLEQLVDICERFVQFNDAVFHNPKVIKITLISRLLAFTCSGVCCFVFENGGASEFGRLLTEQQRPAATYTMGFDEVGIQSSATSLFWMLDVPAGRLYQNLGKRPPFQNMHVKWTLQECKRLETISRKRL